MLTHRSHLFLLFLALSTTLGCATSPSNSCAGQENCEEEDLLDDSALLQTKLQKTVQTESDDMDIDWASAWDTVKSGVESGVDTVKSGVDTVKSGVGEVKNKVGEVKNKVEEIPSIDVGDAMNAAVTSIDYDAVGSTVTGAFGSGKAAVTSFDYEGAYKGAATFAKEVGEDPEGAWNALAADAEKAAVTSFDAANVLAVEVNAKYTALTIQLGLATEETERAAKREALRAKRLAELKAKEAIDWTAKHVEMGAKAAEELKERIAQEVESHRKALEAKIAAEKRWSEAKAAKARAAQEKEAAEHNARNKKNSVEKVAAAHLGFAEKTINSWGKILETCTGLANPVPGLAGELGPIKQFVDKIPVPDLTGVGARVIEITSRYSTGETGVGKKLSKCGVIDGPINLDGAIHSWGAAQCADMQVGSGGGLGLASCDMCFTAAYISVTSNGLNHALESLIGFSPIKLFALWSNVRADLVLINRDVILHKQLPKPLNQPMNQGLNLWGNIGTPTTCEVFGLTDLLCVLLRPAWPTNGVTLFFQISVSKFMVTKVEFGASLASIPIYGPTRFEVIELKYTMEPGGPVIPEEDSPHRRRGAAPKVELPSSTVTGLVKLRTIIDLNPILFTGQLSVGIKGPKTTVGVGLMSTGIIMLANAIGPWRFGIYDLKGSVELGIVPTAPPTVTLESWLIGGGVCIGKNESCANAYNRTSAANLTDVIMGQLYMAMQLNGESIPKFCFALTSAPFSFGKLFDMFSELEESSVTRKDVEELRERIPSFLLEAELTGFQKCDRADKGDKDKKPPKEAFDCWVTITANAGDEVNEFDFGNLGVEPGEGASATGSSLSIGPGVSVSAGLTIFGAHAGIKLNMEPTYLNAKIRCSKLSLFDNQLILSRSTKAGTKELTDMDGPVMQFNAQWAQNAKKIGFHSLIPGDNTVVSFSFDARLKLWDFLDAEAVVQFNPFHGSMVALGVPLWNGAFIGNAFVVYDLVPPGKIKLGVMIELSTVQKVIDILIRGLQDGLSAVQQAAEDLKHAASELKDSINARLDSAHAWLTGAQATLDGEQAKVDAAADNVADAKSECKRFEDNCKSHKKICGLLQLGNDLSLSEYQARIDSFTPEQMAQLNWIAHEQAEMATELKLKYQNTSLEGDTQLLSIFPAVGKILSDGWEGAKDLGDKGIKATGKLANDGVKATEKGFSDSGLDNAVHGTTDIIDKGVGATEKGFSDTGLDKAVHATTGAIGDVVDGIVVTTEAVGGVAEDGTKIVYDTTTELGRQACREGLDFACEGSGKICGAGVDVAEAALRLVSKGIGALEAALEAPKKALKALKALSDEAFKFFKSLVERFEGMLAKIEDALDQLSKYKLLALGFKAEFSVGEKLKASVHASLKYAKGMEKGQKVSSETLRQQFLPDDFKEPATSDAYKEPHAMSDAYKGSAIETTTPTTTTTSTTTTACDESLSGNGAGYRGCQSITRKGKTCQAWSSQSPQKHTRTPENYPSAGLEGNFCRNPDSGKTIWCYTTSSTRWDYCDPKASLVQTSKGTVSLKEDSVYNMDTDFEEDGHQVPKWHTDMYSIDFDVNFEADTQQIARACFDLIFPEAKKILDVVRGDKDAIADLEGKIDAELKKALGIDADGSAENDRLIKKQQEDMKKKQEEDLKKLFKANGWTYDPKLLSEWLEVNR